MTTGFKTSGGCYLDLITNFPPRIVRTEEEFIATQNQIYTILDKQTINKDEQDYLNLLGVILYEYEEESEPIPPMSSNDMLRLLLEESELGADKLLTIFPNAKYVSDVLEGKRNITKEQKSKLAKLFNVSPSFFDQKLN
jgi:HTH-type transcriptional regulator/antitoxin HigA